MTWNGNTPFTEQNAYGSRPRKRKVMSESELRDAIERKGSGSLLFYEELFELKELEDGSRDYVVKERNGEKIKLADRINAANAWTRLVFIQPKEDEVEAINDIKLTPEQHEELNKFLILKGIDSNKTSFYKELMVQTSEFLKELAQKNV